MIYIVPKNTCEIKVDCECVHDCQANFSQIYAFIICDPHIVILL